MMADFHERARQLLTEAWIEDLGADDAAWLSSHVASCERCARFAAGLQESVSLLRSARIHAEPALVDASKRSARLYAERVRETQNRFRLLAVSCVLSAIWGGVSLPWLWRAFVWIGQAAKVPDAVWQAAFVLFWLLPSVVAAVALFGPPHGASWWSEQGGE